MPVVSSTTRRSAFLGFRDMLPLMIPAFPFGAVLGLAIADTEFVPNFVGWLSSSIIFGGAAQLTAVTLLASGAGFFPPLIGAVVVNVRHVMYSAALVPRFREQPRWFRWFGPYLLLDQNFALSSVKEADPVDWRAYYIAAGGTAWVTWQIAVAVGIVFGPVIPEAIDLSFAVPALFIGLLVPSLRTRPALLAAVVGALVTASFAGVPNRGGMLIGGVAGVVAGTWADLRSRS